MTTQKTILNSNSQSQVIRRML